MAKVIRFVSALLLLWLAACGPQATPFPADIPVSATNIPEAGATISTRYALATNTHGLVSDLELIQAYGDFPDSTRSPIESHIALILKADDFPINNSVVQKVLRHSIYPQAVLDRLNISVGLASSIEAVDAKRLRGDLANSGWPDGFSLNMAYSYTPGFDVVEEQFHNAGIRIQSYLMQKSDITLALDNNRVQLALINWGTPDERMQWTAHFGENNVIDLYTIPISYRAVPGLNITFTSDGWPLVNR